jgi:hypothetical protein
MVLEKKTVILHDTEKKTVILHGTEKAILHGTTDFAWGTKDFTSYKSSQNVPCEVNVEYPLRNYTSLEYDGMKWRDGPTNLTW